MAHLRIDKDGVFVDGRKIPDVRSVVLEAGVGESPKATIEVWGHDDVLVDLAGVEVDYQPLDVDAPLITWVQ